MLIQLAHAPPPPHFQERILSLPPTGTCIDAYAYVVCSIILQETPQQSEKANMNNTEVYVISPEAEEFP